MLKAVSFDLWDTVIRDDSDEPRRAARGLPSKREARRALARAAFETGSRVPREGFECAFDTMEAAFHHVWHAQQVTWTVSERLRVLGEGLGCPLPPARREALARRLEDMEIEIPPDPVEGIAEAIAVLSARFPLAVVSDTIYSPGRCLRRWLRMHGLGEPFRAFAFSDEIGRSKPHRDMFAHVARELGVELGEMLHVGDRDHNDVKGPQALGMKAVLFTASRDADRAGTSADAVCERASELADAVMRVAGAPGCAG